MNVRWMLIGLIFCCARGISAQSVDETVAREVAEQWIEQRSELQQKLSPFFSQPYQIRTIEKINLDSQPLPFFVVRLNPTGYIIINSDQRLAPVVAYSESSELILDEVPENAFRAVLKTSMDQSFNKLTRAPKGIETFEPAAVTDEWNSLSGTSSKTAIALSAPANTVLGPFLTTTWHQTKHYNDECPLALTIYNSQCGNRVPAGCVAVVGAQIMNYYEWPYRGKRSHSYSELAGDVTGSHTVDCSDAYDWDNMRNSYLFYSSYPAEQSAAVAELIYEVGACVNMDYNSGTSYSYTARLEGAFNYHFLYEKGVTTRDNQAAMETQLENEMLLLRPAAITIPGHAVVADGLNNTSGSSYFHCNYGWGGQNDGWFLVSSIAGNPATACITGLYPELIPINTGLDSSTNKGSNVAVGWNIAAVRQAEMQSVEVLEGILTDVIFSDSADDFSHFESSTRTYDSTTYPDWEISSSGYDGNCFYKSASFNEANLYSLTSCDYYYPQNGSELSFRLKTSFFAETFRVLISTDDGASYTTEYSTSTSVDWKKATVVDLSGYAGEEILIRFEIQHGMFVGGSVWLDSIELSGGEWHDWQPVATSTNLTGTTLTDVTLGQHTYAFRAYNGSEWGAISPFFVVEVEESDDADNDGMLDAWELANGLNTSIDDSNLDKDGDGKTNYEEYISGTWANDINSYQIVEPLSLENDHCLIRFNSITGRTYLIEYCDDLVDNSWLPVQEPASSGNGDLIEVNDTTPPACRFYRLNIALEP